MIAIFSRLPTDPHEFHTINDNWKQMLRWKVPISNDSNQNATMKSPKVLSHIHTKHNLLKWFFSFSKINYTTSKFVTLYLYFFERKKIK